MQRGCRATSFQRKGSRVHYFVVMAEGGEGFRETLSNIARQARSLLENFNDTNVQSIEQRLLQQRPLEFVPTTRSSAPHQTIASPMTSVALDGKAVAAQLRNLLPTVGKRSSFGGKLNKAKKPPLKKTKKDIVHKDVVLLPSPDTRSLPTNQMRCRLGNNGFVIHAFPVDKSLQEEDFRAQIRDLFPHLGETKFEFVKACYGQIVSPNLASGVYFSALHVLGLAGQGSIYI